MGLITDLLLVGARNGAKKTARNTARANLLAEQHHAEIVAQNATHLAFIQQQQQHEHGFKYATDPAYKQYVDEQYALQQQRRAELVAAQERERRRKVAGRDAALAYVRLAIAIGFVACWIWSTQMLVAAVRRRPRNLWHRNDLTAAWRDVAPKRQRRIDGLL